MEIDKQFTDEFIQAFTENGFYAAPNRTKIHVKLDGKGFQKLREAGTIKIGDEIIKYDLDQISSGVPSTRSPIIINNMEKVEKIEVLSLSKIVKIGEPIMKVTLK